MKMFTLANAATGAVATLRPTHARLVVDRMPHGSVTGGPEALKLDAKALAETAASVRDDARCRTKRRDLRLVMLMCAEGGTAMEGTSEDAELMRDLAQKAA